MMDDYRSGLAMHHLQSFIIHFCGFSAPVPVLLSNGWQFHADMNLYEYGVTVVLTNTNLRLSGILPDSSMMERAVHGGHISINSIAPSSNVVLERSMQPEFAALAPRLREGLPIDMPSERFRLADLLDFSEPQELIVDPDEVEDLLGRIVELQRPQQEVIRKKERKSFKKTEASIITLQEYRG